MQLPLKGKKGWYLPAELEAELDKYMAERSFQAEVVRKKTLRASGKSLAKRYNARVVKTNAEIKARIRPNPNFAQLGRGLGTCLGFRSARPAVRFGCTYQERQDAARVQNQQDHSGRGRGPVRGPQAAVQGEFLQAVGDKLRKEVGA